MKILRSRSLSRFCFSALILYPFLSISSPARADWSSTHSTQLILGVDAANGVAVAGSRNFAISGSGLMAANLNQPGSTFSPSTATVHKATADGAIFSLQMNYQSEDTRIATDVDNGILPAYSDVTLNTDGTAGLLSGTISSPTKGAATAGGPGTQATLTQSNVFSVF